MVDFLLYLSLVFTVLTLSNIAMSNSGKEDSTLSSQVEDVTEDTDISGVLGIDTEYHYESSAKLDPFIPPLISSLVAKAVIDVISPLQRFNLFELKLVGVWVLRNNEKKAMIMTPKMEGVVVGVGDPLGKRGGKIVKISDKHVVTREFSLAADGVRKYQDFNLWLENDKPSKKSENIILSKKIGLPTNFGYGKKPLVKSKKTKEDILDSLNKQKKDKESLKNDKSKN